MKPPVCHFCDNDSRDAMALVYFLRTPQGETWHKRAKEEPGFTGHPPEAAWFCSKHIKAARNLSHLTLPQAMKVMRDLNPQ